MLKKINRIRFNRSIRVLVASAAMLAWSFVGVVPEAGGSVVSYWTFEGTEEGAWLKDSVGSNDLSIHGEGTPEHLALPETGAGSAFPDPIPQTGAANVYGADLTGGYLHTDTGNGYNRNLLTVEGFIHLTNVTSQQFFFILKDGTARQFAATTNSSDQLNALIYNASDGSWSSSGVNRVVATDLSLTANKDYYFAMAVSTGEDEGDRYVDFWLQNLTDSGNLLYQRVSHGHEALFQDNALFVRVGESTALEAAADFRYSDGALTQSDLLIIPEPQTLGLILFGLAGVVVRRFRRI